MKEQIEMSPNRPLELGRIQPYDAIVFDVDSTLVTIEGLDWLAKYKGCEDGVVELTRRSMEGIFDFQEAMIQKMNILSPSYADLERLGQAYCDHIVPGAADAIAQFHAQGKEVWILTGNFQPAVGILARKLEIPIDRVISNRVFFDDAKAYAGFDAESPLAKNGGKAIKIQDVLNREGKRVAFVGDGKTDLEVKPYVALFIGFGGVAERAIVKAEADIYISELSLASLPDLIP